jgi:hypothetical protein
MSLCRTLLAAVVLLVWMPSGTEASTVEQRWLRHIEDTHQALVKGKHGKAMRSIRQLEELMLEAVGVDPAASEAVARICALRAIAEMGLGDEETARWYWYMAHSMDPEVTQSDFSAYGEPATLLQRVPLWDEAAEEPDEPLDLQGVDIEAPWREDSPPPDYPLGMRRLRVEDSITVQLIIGKDGKPCCPNLADEIKAPTLAYAAMVALRQWRFRPATLAGEPAQVFYNLTVNFKLENPP